MPHTDTIPVSASTASTGKGIRYISNWAYGYSGVVGAAQTPEPLLDFTSGSGFILAQFQLVAAVEVSDNFEFIMTLNDIEVYKQRLTNTVQLYPYGFEPIQLLLPPQTAYKATLANLTSDTSRDWCLTMTGRVYGAE